MNLEYQVASLELCKKFCPKCSTTKPLHDFYQRKKFRWISEKYQAYCKTCTLLRRSHWYHKMGGKERTCSRQKADRLRRPEHFKIKHRRWNWDSKIKALTAYGGVCACCFESEPMFLAIDHINNDGAAHRRTITNQTIYVWLRKNNYPQGFQVLCHNCNMAKAFWKECPHEIRRTSIVA